MSKRVLVVDDDDLVRGMIVTHLENITNDIEIVQTYCGDNACEILNEDQNFDLIFSDYEMPHGSGGDLWSYMQRNKIDIPFILNASHRIEDLAEFENFFQSNKYNAYLKKPSGINEVKTIITTSLLKNNIDLGKHDIHPPIPQKEFFKVRIFYFWRNNKTLCDIYIKLSDNKYVKLLKAGDHYKKESIKKYADKDVKYLYIKSHDYHKYLNQMEKTPYLEFETQNLTDQEVAENVLATQELLHNILLDVGISPGVVKLAQKSVDSIIDMTKRNNELNKLLEKLKIGNNYLYDHSFLIAAIAIAITKQMNWSSPQTIEKLTLAAIFHDLTMNDSSIAYKIDLNLTLTTKELLDQKIIDKYVNHAEEMAMMIKKYKDHFPIDVDKIILEHHILDNYSNPNMARITPMSAVFILSHLYVCELYKADFETSQKDFILQKLKNNFSTGVFKSPLEALIKCF